MLESFQHDARSGKSKVLSVPKKTSSLVCFPLGWINMVTNFIIEGSPGRNLEVGIEIQTMESVLSLACSATIPT